MGISGRERPDPCAQQHDEELATVELGGKDYPERHCELDNQGDGS
jgi:hypothetical protein